MESEESPLDVLSRAATMVSPPAYGESDLFFFCLPLKNLGITLLLLLFFLYSKLFLS